MEFQEYQLKKISRILLDLLALGILIFGLSGTLPVSSNLGAAMGSAMLYVAQALICTMIAVKILWTNHGDIVANGMVNFLLWPRRFLKKAPPPLSQAQALMVRGKYEEAEELLTIWHREYPESVSVALLFFELLTKHFKRNDEALQIAGETLSCTFRTRAEDAFPLLEKSIDLFCSSGHPEKAAALLAQESGKSSLYAPPQLQYIRQKETVLRKGL